MDPIETEQDLQECTDEELDTLRLQVAREKERREAVASIPSQIRALAQTYRAGGGDEAALTAAIEA